MARRSILTALIVSVILSASVLPGATVAASGQIRVDIKRNAVLLGDGEAVLVAVTARCPEGYEVLEAFVYISQSGNESDFGFFPLTCTGKQQRFVVRVNAFDDGRFESGPAHSSAYVLVVDPATEETLTAQDTEQVKIRDR